MGKMKYNLIELNEKFGQEVVEKYKNGDNNGAIEIVQNTLKTNNVDIEKMQKQTENYIKGFMNRQHIRGCAHIKNRFLFMK